MSFPSKLLQQDSEGNTSRVQAFIDQLIATFPDIVEQCTDGEKTFSYDTTTSVLEDATTWLKALSSHADRCDARLTCTIAEGLSGQLGLQTDNRLVVKAPFERDKDLFPELEDKALQQAVDELAETLSRPNASILLEDLEEALALLDTSGLTLSLELTVSVNKKVWQEELLGPNREANVALFFFPCKFLEALERKSLSDIERNWFVLTEQPVVILLIQARGYLEGDYLACFGLDALDDLDSYLTRPRDFERLAKLRHLRDQQCNWNGKPAVLTPDHFVLQNRGLGGDCAREIQAEFRAVAAQLAVGYLTNRTDSRAEPPTSRFDGYKTCRVLADRQTWRALLRDEGLNPGPLLALYRWAYENYSGDQLGVVRQLVSLELEEGPEGNAERLLEGAAKMLETARINLQQLMQRNISEYFVARNQVCEFLRKYTDEIASTLSDLTGELISNLYKTLAAIIGAIVAAELTQKPAAVVLTTAGLYFLYVTFIIIYFLPSVWNKFHLKKKEYRNNVKQFVRKDVLLKEEIERFQGQSYKDSEGQFYKYFAATLIIYALLAGLAFSVFVLYGLRLWLS